MAKLKIVWTDDALDEFEAIWEYYYQRNGSAAYSIRIKNKTLRIVKRLQVQPLSGRLLEDRRTRSVQVEKFQLLYQVFPGRIEILSLWDPKQEPSKRWDQR